MDCSYTLTKSEVVQAMQLHGRGANSTLLVLAFVGIGLVLLGIFTEYKAIGFGGAAGGFLGYSAVLFLIIPFNAKRQYKQNRALRSEMSMHLSEQGVGFKAETGESKLQWSDIHKWKYAKDMYLLYITSNMFYMVPSRALTNQTALANLLVEQIGPKKA